MRDRFHLVKKINMGNWIFKKSDNEENYWLLGILKQNNTNHRVDSDFHGNKCRFSQFTTTSSKVNLPTLLTMRAKYLHLNLYQSGMHKYC